MKTLTAEQKVKADKIIERCKERIAHAVNLLEIVSRDGHRVCEENDWDCDVFYQMDEATTKLGYVIATLIRWDSPTID